MSHFITGFSAVNYLVRFLGTRRGCNTLLQRRTGFVSVGVSVWAEKQMIVFERESTPFMSLATRTYSLKSGAASFYETYMSTHTLAAASYAASFIDFLPRFFVPSSWSAITARASSALSISIWACTERQVGCELDCNLIGATDA